MSPPLPFGSGKRMEREKKKKKKKQRNVTGGRRTSRKRENKRGCGRAEIRGVHVLTIISFVVVVVVLVGHRRYIIIIIIIIIVGVYDSLPITASVTGIKRNYVILYCGLTIVRSLSVVSLFLHDFLI